MIKSATIALMCLLVLPLHSYLYRSLIPMNPFNMPTPAFYHPWGTRDNLPINATQWDEPPFELDSIFFNTGMIQSIEITRREEGLDIRGTMPVIDVTYTSGEIVNYQIEKTIANFINDARRLRARSISFHYEIRETNELVSIIIHSSVTSVISRAAVQTVNFSPRTGQIQNLTEAMGMDIYPLIDSIIADMIRRNPERYYAALRSQLRTPTHLQAFYKDAFSLVLLFDEFQLSTAAGAITSIRLPRNNIVTLTITPDDYHVDGNYNLKMVPVRFLEQLGYELQWDDFSQQARIYRNELLMVEMQPDENAYHVHGAGAHVRSLEAAPALLEDDRLFVPVTFFDQILNLVTYSVDVYGNITFLAFTGDPAQI